MFLKNTFKKRLLLFLAAGLDFWDSYVSYSATKYQLYFGRWRKSAIYSTVSQLLSVGQIEKIVKNGKVFLRLTSKGNQQLKEDIPLVKYSQKIWDGYWRLVIFDIPEKNKTLRNSLRRKLISLGFGQWQKSVYITPFNLEEEMSQFLKAQKNFGSCFCLRAKRFSRGDDRQIAKIAFKLEEINNQYYQISEEITELTSVLEQGKLKSEETQLLINKFLDIALKDPGLPKELLPDDWWADETKKDLKDFLIAIKNYHQKVK